MPGPSSLEAPTTPHMHSLSQNVCEEPVCPLPGVGVQGSVQVVFADGFGVDDVGHALHALEPLQSLQKDAPGHALPAARGPHHHQAVVDLGDLIELENLGANPVAPSALERRHAKAPSCFSLRPARDVCWEPSRRCLGFLTRVLEPATTTAGREGFSCTEELSEESGRLQPVEQELLSKLPQERPLPGGRRAADRAILHHLTREQGSGSQAQPVHTTHFPK